MREEIRSIQLTNNDYPAVLSLKPSLCRGAKASFLDFPILSFTNQQPHRGGHLVKITTRPLMADTPPKK